MVGVAVKEGHLGRELVGVVVKGGRLGRELECDEADMPS